MDGLATFTLLERALPSEHCPAFMFMGTVGAVYTYKHGITRRYLNLSDDGAFGVHAHAYDAASRRYTPIAIGDALAHVFDGLEAAGASRATPYDDEYRALRDATLERLGICVRTVSSVDGPELAAQAIMQELQRES